MRLLAGEESMHALVGFMPWIAFWVLGSGESFELGAIVGLVASLLVSLPEILHRRLKILDGGTLGFFVVIAVMGITADSAWFERFANPISNGALAAITLVSILVGKPFTLQYARESVPEQYWNAPAFIRANYVITWVWFAAFAVQTVSTLVVVLWPVNRILFRWVVPYGALVLAAAYTRWSQQHAHHTTASRAATPHPAATD